MPGGPVQQVEALAREGNERMAQVYQHWKGQLRASAGPLQHHTHEVDVVFPPGMSQAARLIGKTELVQDSEVFPHLIALAGHVGPYKVSFPEELHFHGTIEYFED